MWGAYGDGSRQSRGCSSAVPAELQVWSVGLRPRLLDAVTALLTDSHRTLWMLWREGSGLCVWTLMFYILSMASEYKH